LGSKCTQDAFAAGALPRTPLWELTALPRPLPVFEGPLRGKEGEGRGREGREGREMDPRNIENRSTPMAFLDPFAETRE